MTQFVEIPANNRSISKRKLVHGVGVNDADYIVAPKINGKQLHCKFYRTWKGMLARCYCDKTQNTHPTYKGCLVADEWLTFSNFKKWMEAKDWRGKHLDKDILVIGNKTYSPETCIFVSGKINNLLTNVAARRGEYPQGVCFHKEAGKYQADCSVNGVSKSLGRFDSISAARDAYNVFKSELVESIAGNQEPILRNALLMHANAIRANLL